MIVFLNNSNVYLTVLQGMIDKLIETGRRYGMEMNVKKKKQK